MFWLLVRESLLVTAADSGGGAGSVISSWLKLVTAAADVIPSKFALFSPAKLSFSIERYSGDTCDSELCIAPKEIVQFIENPLLLFDTIVCFVGWWLLAFQRSCLTSSSVVVTGETLE